MPVDNKCGENKERKIVWRPDDLITLGFNYKKWLGNPGEYPFTRGPYETMYAGRLWTMRQFAGFGTPEETNARFKYLWKQGQTGYSVAFDMPSMHGYDSDHQDWGHETGIEGVSISTILDMEALFEGIPIDDERVSVSMTINSPAAMIWAMYLAMAEKRGVDFRRLRGTIQNDILKEFFAQKEWIYPIAPSIRLVVDTIEFSVKNVPLWQPISISGYHIREAGSTAVQELAFTLADGIAYVEACVARGMNVDDFAHRLSFFWNSHNNFFEEIAKRRAARRMWANICRDRFGAKNSKSLAMRMHSQTAGCSLTSKEPYNNIVRTAYQALAAVLGGTQSLHTNSLDETEGLPTEEAVLIALRTQQILAYETKIPEVADPLAGSYFIEALTDKIEQEANEYLKKIDGLGGMVRAIEAKFPQSEIDRAAYQYQLAVDKAEETVVGVNRFVSKKAEKRKKTAGLRVNSEAARKRQIDSLRRIKQERNSQEVKESLNAIHEAALDGRNMMPYFISAAKCHATLQEMCDTLREIWGEYSE